MKQFLEVVSKIYLPLKLKEAHALHSKLTFLGRGTIKRQNRTQLGTVNVIFQEKVTVNLREKLQSH